MLVPQSAPRAAKCLGALVITYTCDQCNGPVGDPADGKLRITATTVRGDEHFCSAICLSAWAIKTGYREAPKPTPVAPKAKALTPEQDAEILRRYQAGKSVANLAAAHGVSKPTIYNAMHRARMASPTPEDDNPVKQAHEAVTRIVDGLADKVLTPPAAPCDIPAKQFPADVTPAAESPPTTPSPAPRPTKPGTTAQCSHCPRSWNLTGRVLHMAIDMHEKKSGHIVDIIDQGDHTNA